MESTTVVSLPVTTAASATNANMSPFLWLLVLGFIIAFILAFSVGANDVANSFGTAVGSGVVTLRQACVLATIFETVGAILLGAKVSETIRSGIIDINMYNGSEPVLMAGSISAMFGSAVWQLVASFLKLPISGTHCIVGATIGFSIVARGHQGVKWLELLRIVSSWFLSPLLSGVMSATLFHYVRKFILNKDDPLPNGLKALPVFYAVTMGINLFSIMFTGAPMLGFNRVPWWGTLFISLGCSLLTALVVWYVVCPRLKKKMKSVITYNKSDASFVEKRTLTDESVEHHKAHQSYLCGSCTPPLDRNVAFDIGGSEEADLDNKHFDTKDLECNNVLHEGMVNAELHGSQFHTVHKDSGIYKDLLLKLHLAKVGECMGEGDKPIRRNNSYTSYTMAIYGIHGSLKDGEGSHFSEAGEKRRSRMDSDSSYSTAMSDGDVVGVDALAVNLDDGESTANHLGGEDVDELEIDEPEVSVLFQFLQILTACFGSFAHGGNDVSGFSIELASAVTVVIASNIGLPVSTTHCKVGSVVSVGWLRSRKSVDWHLFRNIFIAWFVTVPISALISAGIMALFYYVFLPVN
ncbi:sodium-dependent phosphate transporter 1-A isoform X2 [Brachyhypopomus gauderio]|uniref:sodium-dependent phosphate transporter 1-A isoform X2 n=1 Tax=Brachyhypopomus gauderio TaxID=698409 RepID=UPI0040437A18